jgi:hypothetical protein
MEGVLRPGWATRGEWDESTVYGEIEAVCFSEQPVDAFIEYVNKRQNHKYVAGYGLFLHRNDVHAAGGLPVIYGLGSCHVETRGDRRLIKADDLPLNEQYRYIVFSPNNIEHPIDWTHEREWRWPANSLFANGSKLFFIGLPQNQYKCRVHAFVEHDADIKTFQTRIKGMMERDEVGKVGRPMVEDYDQYWKAKLLKMHLVSLETAKREGISRFEDWPDKFKSPLIP